jgi:hypothetical protein
MSEEIVEPCFVLESTTTCAVYLEMVENFVFPQTVAEVDSLILQQDGAPTHFSANVRGVFKKYLPTKGSILFEHTSYVLIWTNDFLVYGSAWEYRLIGLHGVLTYPWTSSSRGVRRHRAQLKCRVSFAPKDYGYGYVACGCATPGVG